MSEPEALRVFVNGTALSVDRAATVLDAVRAFSAEEAGGVAAGTRAVTDSRGLPIALDARLGGGAVLRIVSSRMLRTAEESEGAGQPEKAANPNEPEMPKGSR
jgi:hypothetical protein